MDPSGSTEVLLLLQILAFLVALYVSRDLG